MIWESPFLPVAPFPPLPSVIMPGDSRLPVVVDERWPRPLKLGHVVWPRPLVPSAAIMACSRVADSVDHAADGAVPPVRWARLPLKLFKCTGGLSSPTTGSGSGGHPVSGPAGEEGQDAASAIVTEIAGELDLDPSDGEADMVLLPVKRRRVSAQGSAAGQDRGSVSVSTVAV